jgi:molybdopterin-guanine dinucleotide biosynthesis protein
MSDFTKQLINDIEASAPPVLSISDKIKASLIPQGIEVPKPDLVFGINGVPIFTKKSISTLIGKAKAGKTTVTAWIASQSILQEIKVLWIDTEQGLYYGSRTQHWVLHMSGINESIFLQMYDLKVHTTSERLEMIEEIIKTIRPDLVIVDGIRDLVFDINNPEEATKRTGDLMRWSESYDCHIMNILHQNKGNEHARGHLGTEMINKSETVIKVEQNEEKLIVCSPEYTRSAPFEAFAFERDEKGMPSIVEGFSGRIATQTDGQNRKGIDPWDIAYNKVIPEIVDFCLKDNEYLTKEEMKQKVRDYFNKNGVTLGDPKARDFVGRLEDVGIVWKNPHIKKRANYGRNPLFNPLDLIISGSISLSNATTDEPPF